MMEEIKPIFKYIGGKTWMKNSLRQEFVNVVESTKINSYVEPFAGGLGAFLSVADLIKKYNIKNIQLNDINSKLINFYLNIKHKNLEVYYLYEKLEKDFKKTIKVLNGVNVKEQLEDANQYYLNVRRNFNESKGEDLIDNILDSARLLFLQKHCFNGVYRENLKGEYNTPFNWNEKEINLIAVKDNILKIHRLFNDLKINFTNKSFEELEYGKNTLFYLDPPYLNEDIGENKYNKNTFDLNQQKYLIKLIKDSSFIYSNHASELLIKELESYNKDLFIRKINRKNTISASSESRKTDKLELLVTKV